MLILLLLLTLVEIFGQEVEVSTTRGRVVGYHYDRGNDTSQVYYGEADVFLGIPFALPPIGNLRYQRPQKIDQYPQNPYNATYFRPICPQNPFNATLQNEDCLYLNIFTPNAKSTKKYPVMVWIHGGGLRVGSNRVAIDGTVRNFVSRGVVVVSIQYRMGFLGFFTTFTDDFPANLGMLDQVEALRFVQEEISNFGGDPKKVTIFGESAGAASVSAHTYSPLSQGLFHQGIQESGTVLTCFEGLLGPTYNNFKLARDACGLTIEQWNDKDFTSLKSCLMKIDVVNGLKFQGQSWGSMNNALCWNIVQDDYFFPGVPRTLWQNRTINKPMIIGTNKDEWALFELQYAKDNHYTSISNYTKEYVEFRLNSMFHAFFGARALDAVKVLEDQYFVDVEKADSLGWLNFLMDIGTNFYFTGVASRDLEFHLLNKNPNVYAYEFNYYSKIDQDPIIPDYYPIRHAGEVCFVFAACFHNPANFNKTDLMIADIFGDAWVNFAKYGKPTLNNTWKAVTQVPNNTEYYEISLNSGPKLGYRTYDQVTLNQALPKIVGEFPPITPDYNNGTIIGCPAGWVSSKRIPKKCYQIFNFTMTQLFAKSLCQKFYLTSFLSIDTAYENKEIQNFIAENSPSCGKTYIGLEVRNGRWVWDNGDGSSYRNWEAGYPIDDSKSSCTVMDMKDGKWTNQPCDKAQCYMCSFEL